MALLLLPHQWHYVIYVDINMSGRTKSNRATVPFDTTLRVRDNCLCFAAQRAARALARRFDEAFRSLGLTSWQFSLLMALNRPQAPSIGEIADFMALDRTTLTANLKPLQRRGLVAIEVDTADRRSRRLQLTVAGLRLLAAAVPVWERTHREVERHMSGEQASAMRGALAMLS
jgi:DNA-binding MarR family transcriptional regulator